MSNTVRITTTRFTTYSRKRQGTQGTRIPSDTTYGVRIADEYSSAFIDTWDKLPLTDLEILEKIALEKTNNSDEVNEFIDFLIENGVGVTIDEQHYDWNEIQEILTDNKCECGKTKKYFMKKFHDRTSLNEVFGCPNCDS